MDSLNIRNYLLVVVAGMFCLLNASVVSAQTATNLKCNWCVGPGEISWNAVEWGAFCFRKIARKYGLLFHGSLKNGVTYKYRQTVFASRRPLSMRLIFTLNHTLPRSLITSKWAELT